jgi:hypothetical protein
MSIDEGRRHALHERLAEVLEPEHATTLLELLPPAGGADVATKHDLANLEQRMDLRFEAMDERFGAELAQLEIRLLRELGALRTELHSSLRAQTWSILGVLLVAILINQVAGHLV